MLIKCILFLFLYVFDEITQYINNTNNTYKSHGKLDILEIVANLDLAILLLFLLSKVFIMLPLLEVRLLSSLKELQNYICHSLSLGHLHNIHN